MIFELVKIIGVIALVMTIASGLIWYERRLLALIQDRYGPNRVGPMGIFQVLADMIKILTKEDWVPPFSEKVLFVLAPAILVITVLASFAVVAFSPSFIVVDLNIGILFFLAMSSLGVYSVVLAGWASNNKYSLTGALRGAAQMLTYEAFMGLAIMGVALQAGSFSTVAIVESQQHMWYCVPQAAGFILFFIAGLAETRRLPFDLPEAENELVAGYHTEYSGMKFAMFFLGEYMGITLVSSMMTILFLGGWMGPVLPGAAWFLIKVFALISIFVILRGTLPRPRYDQLMRTGWLILLPLAMINLLVTAFIVLISRGG